MFHDFYFLLVTTHTINSIRKNQAGIYQCMSSNDAGMAYSAIEVEVEGDQTAVNNEVPDNIAKALPGKNSQDPFFFFNWS